MDAKKKFVTDEKKKYVKVAYRTIQNILGQLLDLISIFLNPDSNLMNHFKNDPHFEKGYC